MATKPGPALSRNILPDSMEVLDLKDLSSRCASLVPFQFRVVHGFLSTRNHKDPTFTANEVYMAHLVTESDTVKITCVDGEFQVPVHSLAKFGLIHDEQIECMTFEDVEELLFASPCPKVVAIRNEYIFPEVALQKNDILIVKEIIRAKTGKNRIAMKFFSVQQQKEIMLYKEQNVQFTTNPRRTQLHLAELEEYLGTDFMPCKAKIFPEGTSMLSRLLTSPTITLEYKEKRQCVIVSHRNSSGDNSSDSNFIGIPTTIGITMTVMEPDLVSDEYRRSLEQSVELLFSYSPTRICPCLNSKSDEVYSIQAQLLSEIYLEKEKASVIEHAPAHYKGMLAKLKGAGESTFKSLFPNEEIAEHFKPSLPRQLSPDLPRRQAIDKERKEECYGTALLLPPAPANEGMSNLDYTTRPAPPTPLKEPKPVCLPPSESQRLHLRNLKITSATSTGVSEDSYGTALLSPTPANEGINSSDYTSRSALMRPVPPTPKPQDSSPVNPILSISQHLHSRNTKASAALVGSKDTDADYEEIEDFPVKDSGIMPQSKPHNPPFIPNRDKKLKPVHSQTAAASSQSYVKFVPNSSAKGTAIDVETRLNALIKQTQEMQEKLSEVTMQVSEIVLWQKQVDTELAALKSACGGSGRNRNAITKDMTPEEVTGMLDTIGLSQYKEAFAREVIDGVTFLSLDDVTLERELQVSSKIHRLRILQLRDGDT